MSNIPNISTYFDQVFFRPGKFAEFDQLLKSDPENLRFANLMLLYQVSQ